jgi:hypothetical protein
LIDKEPNILAKWGLAATWIYLIILIGGVPLLGTLGAIEIKPISLNELGDLLAGAFGPLAIFWLVLGFFQQGHELRLQVKELALSVEQQKELVGVSRETLDHERNLVNLREISRKASIQPKFIFKTRGGAMTSGRVRNKISITNSGYAVSDARFSIEPEPYQGTISNIAFWEKGKTLETDIQFMPQGPVQKTYIKIFYLDADGIEHEKKYCGTAVDGEPMKLTFSEVQLPVK